MAATFRDRVLSGEVLVGTFLNLGSPVVAEVSGRAGFDWLLVDLEHGAVGDADLSPMLQAIVGTGTPAIVRVEQGSRIRIGRALDLGAEGIMVPRVDSIEEARDVARWLRYPPAGVRGVATFTRGLGFGARGHGAVSARNDEIVGIVQIESRAALDAADQMAGLDGVDVLFLGPGDMSHALGIPGRIDHPDFQPVVERIGAAARAHGKAAGVLIWRPEDVDRYIDAGYTVFSLSSEGSILSQALHAGLAAVRDRAGAGR